MQLVERLRHRITHLISLEIYFLSFPAVFNKGHSVMQVSFKNPNSKFLPICELKLLYVVATSSPAAVYSDALF